MNKSIKSWLTGISIPQEYVCLGTQDVQKQLTVTVSCLKKTESLNVTSQQLFLGYRPVVVAIVFRGDENCISNESEVCLNFSNDKFESNTNWNRFHSDRKCVARLSLTKIDQRDTKHSKIVFYRGMKGQHTFISPGHQKINSFIEQLRNKPEGNISLPHNLYEQVRIAYSIPRLISLITVSDGALLNLFPTDLHGEIGDGFYVGSLRIGGRACQQVEMYKRIVLSEVDSIRYRQVYALGKQHMKPLSQSSEFELSDELSESFKLPLPKGVGRYRELELIDHLDVGIHRIFIYKVINDHPMMNFNTLAHIHQYYAQWRINHKLPTHYLLR